MDLSDSASSDFLHPVTAIPLEGMVVTGCRRQKTECRGVNWDAEGRRPNIVAWTGRGICPVVDCKAWLRCKISIYISSMHLNVPITSLKYVNTSTNLADCELVITSQNICILLKYTHICITKDIHSQLNEIRRNESLPNRFTVYITQINK